VLVAETAGYILRIATKQWLAQVFERAVYYTGFRRKWIPGKTILFVHRINIGDAIVGYGEIEDAYEIDDLSDMEKRECEKHGWKKAITFKYIMPFEKPLLIKETFLRERKYRGRYMHGLQLGKEQLSMLVSQAERIQRH
jgi:hypothetical protein